VQSNRYQAGQIRRFYNEISGSVFGEYHNLTNYFNLRKTNTALASENAYLRMHIAQSYQMFDRKMFIVNDTIYRLQYDYIHTKIIHNSINKRNNYLMINKGANQGVKAGMAVISPVGVVGIVKIVSNNFSSVMSLLHSDSKISAKIKRNNFSTGSVSWDGKTPGVSQMMEVPPHINVQIGDTVVTSGYSLDFPEGIFIGTVSQIRTRPGDNFHTLDIKLSTDFSTLDHVYVIRNLSKGELDELQQQQLQDE
jgi:rod shape-determining protein MreC